MTTHFHKPQTLAQFLANDAKKWTTGKTVEKWWESKKSLRATLDHQFAEDLQDDFIVLCDLAEHFPTLNTENPCRENLRIGTLATKGMK